MIKDKVDYGWLTKDVIGEYSQIVYGQKGNKIEVLGKRDEFLLVKFGSEIFHVRPENLSKDDPAKDLAGVTEPEIRKDKPIEWLPEPEDKRGKKEAVKKGKPGGKKGQIDLF